MTNQELSAKLVKLAEWLDRNSGEDDAALVRLAAQRFQSYFMTQQKDKQRIKRLKRELDNANQTIEDEQQHIDDMETT